jgi:hypothetical protein
VARVSGDFAARLRSMSFGAADQISGLAPVANQILVIFIMRTAHFLQDQPPSLRLVGSPAAFGLAVALRHFPPADWLGFVAVPAPVLGALACATVAHLLVF